MSKLSKEYLDAFGDSAVVETDESTHVYLSILAQVKTVEFKPKQVKRLVKQLVRWLRENDHVETPKRVEAVVTFAEGDIMGDMPLAVTLQDEDGHIIEVVWQRRDA